MKLGFLNILTIIFVVAKIVGAISWSWWLVFAPTIIVLLIAFVVWAIIIYAAYKAS